MSVSSSSDCNRVLTFLSPSRIPSDPVFPVTCCHFLREERPQLLHPGGAGPARARGQSGVP